MTSAVKAARTPRGALRGVRVVEFGQYIPGPLLGMLLADQGADVTKVERPGGDPGRRQPAFATWNRGKRSIILDLKSAEGLRKADALAATADVLIENFRPGVADRLGMGYEHLSRLNPRLVYCSLPGFGEGSPDRHHRGWEPLVAASTGLYQSDPLAAAPTGLYQSPEAMSEPLFTPLPVASTFAAIVAAASVAMALVARQRTGLGQRIEVPLHSAMFTAIGTYIGRLHDIKYTSPLAMLQLIMVRQYQCSDGRWVQNHGYYERFVRRFLEVAGHPEWTGQLAAFVGQPVDPEAVDMWVQRLKSIFGQRTAQEWEDVISGAGGACTVCRTIDEWLNHEHALGSGMVVEVEDAHLGRMKQPGIAVNLRGTRGNLQGRAPLVGEHTEEILAELRDGNSPTQLVSEGQEAHIMSALEGIRVLDLCTILAGPTCGRTMAEFGADVIKIDDPGRPYELNVSVDTNRGKRSMLLDLKREEGREVLWRLIETADVLVENNRKGSLDKLGLGYEDVRKRKPDIIYASLNAYGYDGPWSDRPGWEQLAQAASGIQVRQGGRDDAPMRIVYPVTDYGTGMLEAYAVALALHERNRTGRGQSVDTGLALTACLLQSPFFLDYEGFDRREPEGVEARGYSALSRLYPASDGWLYFHCPDESGWSQLTKLQDFAPLGSDHRFSTPEERAAHDGNLAEVLKQIFPQRTRGEWMKLLHSVDISAIENIPLPDLLNDPYVRRAGLVVTREHPGCGRVDHIGNTARLSGTPMQLGQPSAILGSKTEEVLNELGYSDQEILALKSAGVVVQTEVRP